MSPARAESERAEMQASTTGPAIEVANEFAEVRVQKIATRNGVRLLVESPRSGQWIALCPLQLEALTRQDEQVCSAMIANPYGPMELGEQ